MAVVYVRSDLSYVSAYGALPQTPRFFSLRHSGGGESASIEVLVKNYATIKSKESKKANIYVNARHRKCTTSVGDAPPRWSNLCRS